MFHARTDFLQAAAPQGPVGPPDRQPLREQLRRRGPPAERDPRRACGHRSGRPLPGFRLNGLKREELIATNSMLLHEVYFDSLGEGGGGDPDGRPGRGDRARLRLAREWRAEFVAMGKALGGGSGWVVLTRSPRDGTARQRLGGRPHAQPGRRHADAGARHVRARLSHRLRQQRRRPMSMPSWPTSPGTNRRALSPASRRRPSRTLSTPDRARRCSMPIPTCW